MKAFVIATFCAVLAIANAGVIGTGLISPIGVRTLAAPSITTSLGSTVVSGPSGTIIDNRNLGLVGPAIASPILRTGLIDNVGLTTSSLALPIAAPGVISARTTLGGAIIGNGLALNGLAVNGLAVNGLAVNGLGLTGAPLLARNGLLW